MLNQPDFPVQFLVSREIARRQKVSDSTATRLALTGALVAPGLLGTIVTRQLAIREAPRPVVAVAASPPSDTGGAPPAPPKSPALAQLEQISKDVKALNDKLESESTDIEKQGRELIERAENAKKERTEIMRLLCQSVGAIAAEGPSREALQQPKPAAYEGKKSEPKG